MFNGSPTHGPPVRIMRAAAKFVSYVCSTEIKIAM